MEMLTYFHNMSLKKNNVAAWLLVLPIDTENMSVIERYPHPVFIVIYRVGDNRRPVNTSTIPHISDQLGTETCEKHCCFIMMLRVLVCKNMNRYERHFGSFHRCSCFPLRNRTYQSWLSERQKHRRWNAYLTSIFGHYIGGYIIN